MPKLDVTSSSNLSSLGSMLRHFYNSELGDNDRSFIERIYNVEALVYADRLRATGLDHCERVLDAGCGFGQWSLCLAVLGPKVISVDVSHLRVHVTKTAFSATGISGLVLTGALNKLPLGDESVDGVFCYGTLFCTPWKAALAEFARVLRPGGRLYFTANGLGYVVNMWMNRPNRTEDFDPREAAVNTFRNTLEYEKNDTPPINGQILINPDEVQTKLERLGLNVIALDAEGRINMRPGEVEPQPFFRAEYHGLPGCYEVLAEKRNVSCLI